MGWAKYAEDDYEIVLERLDHMANRDNLYIGTAIFPPIACPVGISTEINYYEEQATTTKVKYKDKKLYCQDCGNKFVFSAGEQRFYEKKGLHQPERCRTCRETNKIKWLVFR